MIFFFFKVTGTALVIKQEKDMELIGITEDGECSVSIENEHYRSQRQPTLSPELEQAKNTSIAVETRAPLNQVGQLYFPSIY